MAINIDSMINDDKAEAGHLRQIVVGLVDVALARLLVTQIVVHQVPMPLYQLITSINSSLMMLTCLVFYRLISFVFLSGTIGMKLFRVILLDSELQPLSMKEKVLAAFFILYKGVDYYKQ